MGDSHRGITTSYRSTPPILEQTVSLADVEIIAAAISHAPAAMHLSKAHRIPCEFQTLLQTLFSGARLRETDFFDDLPFQLLYGFPLVIIFRSNP